MSTIKVNCIDQALAFENTPLITSGGLEENFVSFTFCGKWAGYERTAVFWRSEADAYHVRLDGADTCQIPPEVTGDEGTIHFGVFGVNAARKQRTTEVLTYHIAKGVITLNTAPSDPTPDIYTQFLAEAAAVKGLVQETRNAEAAFETAMNAKQAAFMASVEQDQAAFMQTAAQTQETYKNEVAEAAAAGLVPDGTITTARLANAAVTAAKLADGAVTSGKLAETAILAVLARGVRIATGSYTGNGETNVTKTVTFDFKPKLLLICGLADTADSMTTVAATWFGVLWDGNDRSFATIPGDDNSCYTIAPTFSGKSVSWPVGPDSAHGLNFSGATYHYFVIGEG